MLRYGRPSGFRAYVEAAVARAGPLGLVFAVISWIVEEDVPFVVELRDGGPGVKVRR
jgi:hypothetical protein